MIRIKVFPLKKIIYRLEIMLAYLAFSIIFLGVISLIFSKKNILSHEVMSRSLTSFESEFEKSNIINHIVRNKIKVLSLIDYDDLGEEKEQENIMVLEQENIYNKVKDELINIEIVEYEKWEKPQKYDTEFLSNGKVKVGSAIINNYSKLSLDLDKLSLVSNKSIDLENNFLIFHTHTSETYTISEEKYSDYYRTENEDYNVTSVGKSLSNSLISKGFNCIHDKTVHDYPSYNGAYKASLSTVEKCLENNKFDFVIDIHRDAISSNESFRPTAEINGESVAKLMFVIGTDSAGLSHDNWMENLKLAIMIQNRANEMYPGLFREIHLSSSRYNQHVSEGAMILEVGATGNTLEEAQGAMKYLAEVIDSMK